MSTREVAEVYGISLNHLAKVAKALTRGGWLVASRGGGGGLQLAVHTLDASVGQIVRFSESTCELAECFDPKSNTCPLIHVCRLKTVLFRAQHAFFSVLDSVPLRDLASNQKELVKIFTDRKG